MASPKASEASWMPGSLLENFLEDLSRRSYSNDILSNYWPNYDDVRMALHVRKGSVGEWQRCNSKNYVEDIPSSFEHHANLSKKNYRSLIYSGDRDMIIPYFTTQEWIRALNYSIIDVWRPWLVSSYRGAGHLPPEYKQEESFAMFSRWFSKKPL